MASNRHPHSAGGLNLLRADLPTAPTFAFDTYFMTVGGKGI